MCWFENRQLLYSTQVKKKLQQTSKSRQFGHKLAILVTMLPEGYKKGLPEIIFMQN